MNNPIIVKLEWQELTEDDKTDINKLDKYLSELLSQEKVSQSTYELIIEYIFARANLAKFISLRLKNQSSSKAKNKQRIMALINKIILEKDSEKKQVIIQQLDEYLCQIFVNIFEEYKNDELNLEKFKMMRLCWVTKISDQTIDNMRNEIGNNHFIDIDKGLSRENIEKLKLYYKNNKIDPNIYLKKAIEELEPKEKVQPSNLQATTNIQKEVSEKSISQAEKLKKKPLPPSTQPIQQTVFKQPIQSHLVNQSIIEERKKVQQQQKMRKNSNNPESQGVSQQQTQSSSSKSQGMENLIGNLNNPLQNQQPQQNAVQTVQPSSKKEDQNNEGDIQIKKKPKKHIQQTVVGASGHIHISPQSQQKSVSSITQQKPPTEGINGSTPQKKVKTTSNPANQQTSQSKNDSGLYNPASVRQVNQIQQHTQNYNPVANQSKLLRLPEKVQQEKVKKLNEESKNLKTSTGIMLMPSTQSLGYGFGGISEQPSIPQLPQQQQQQQQQQQPPFSSSQQGSLQMNLQDNNVPYIPGNPNILNTNIPPPPPPQNQQNISSMVLNQGQMIQKNQQPLEMKQQPPPQTILSNPPLPPVPQHQFGSSNQEFNLNSSQQKQNIHNKPSQSLLPPQNLNYQMNIQQPPIQDQLNPIQLNQNMNNPSNIQRQQDFSMQNQQLQQQNQHMFLNQRVTGSGPLENQTINLNVRNKFPSVQNMPFQQPPPPGPLSQLIDSQPPFQMQMEIENQNNPNIVRRQQPPFNQIIQPQHLPPPPPPPVHQQNMSNLNGSRTPQGSSQNLNSSGQIEPISQPPHIITPYQQPPPPPGLPIRQMSQNAYNLIGIQQDKTSLFYELFNFLKPTLNSKQYFLSQIEEMKQNKTTFIHPSLFLNRNEEVVFISKSSIYDSLPYQCAQCGIRFAVRDDLRAHLEDHTIKNLKIIEAKREKEKEKKNRQMFYDVNQWIDCQDEDIEKEQETESESEKTYFVPQNKSNNGKCDLCQEPFILTWSEEIEDWVYENAKRFEIFETSTGKNQIATVHLTCYKVLEKQSELENQGNEEQVESTEKLLN